MYYGLRNAIPISYLRPIFEHGGTPEHVDAARPLADDYWNWAKNQAFEKVHNLDGRLDNRAVYARDRGVRHAVHAAVRHYRQRAGHAAAADLGDRRGHHRRAVEVGVIHAENDGDSDDLRYKVYADPAERTARRSRTASARFA